MLHALSGRCQARSPVFGRCVRVHGHARLDAGISVTIVSSTYGSHMNAAWDRFIDPDDFSPEGA